MVSGKAYRIIQVTKVKPFIVMDKQLKAILLTSETSKNEMKSWKLNFGSVILKFWTEMWSLWK